MGSLFHKLTTALLISSMLPMRVLGAVGDIYDLSSNTVYTSADSNALKSDLKNKKVNENELYVERSDGKIYRYADIKRAERQAILSILTAKGIDLTNADDLKAGIIQYNSEIETEQETQLSKLVGETPPENTNPPSPNDGDTDSQSSLASVDITYRTDDRKLYIELSNAKGADGKDFVGNIETTVKGSYEGNVDTKVITLASASITTQLIPDMYTVEVKNGDTLVASKTIDLTATQVDWTLDADSIESSVAITGNSTDGYIVNYKILAMESYTLDERTVLREADTSKMKLHVFMASDTKDDIEVLTHQLEGNTGNVELSELPYTRLYYNITDMSDEYICEGSIQGNTYVPGGFVTTDIQVAPKGYTRKIAVFTPSYDTDVFKDVTYSIYDTDEDLVYSNSTGSTGLVYTELPEGVYKVVVTADDGEFLLDIFNFTMEYPDINNIKFERSGVPTDNSETLKVMFEHDGERQYNEEFKVDIIDNLTGEHKLTTLRDSAVVELTCGDGLQSYTFNVLNDDNDIVASRTHYVSASLLVNITTGDYLVLKDDDTGKVTHIGVQLIYTPKRNFTIEEMSKHYKTDITLRYIPDDEWLPIETDYLESKIESVKEIYVPVEYVNNLIGIDTINYDLDSEVIWGYTARWDAIFTELETVDTLDVEATFPNSDVPNVEIPKDDTNSEITFEESADTLNLQQNDAYETDFVSATTGEDVVFAQVDTATPDEPKQNSNSDDSYFENNILLPSKDEDDELIATFDVE